VARDPRCALLRARRSGLLVETPREGIERAVGIADGEKRDAICPRGGRRGELRELSPDHPRRLEGDDAGRRIEVPRKRRTNQVLAQIFLFGQKFADLMPAQKAERLTVEVLPKKLDEEVALEMVKGFGGVVTQLTKTQADYIGVTVEGPFKPHAYRY
jgi:hypothetical protein